MMMGPRTDLALEAHGLWRRSFPAGPDLPGVRVAESVRSGRTVTEVDILDAQGAQALGKPVGRYVTLDLWDAPPVPAALPAAIGALSRLIADLLPPLRPQDPVLVAGLGNRAVPPDALGPRTADRVLATCHLAPDFPALRPVAVLSAGVQAATGLESADLLRAVADHLHPALVVAVDALTARSARRLGRTVQLSTAGLVPGSGAGARRRPIDAETLGVPVLSLGCPTAADAAQLCYEALSPAGSAELPPLPELSGLLLTPHAIDSRVDTLAHVLGRAISQALQPRLTPDELELFLS